MLFNSFEFALFLPIVFLLYWFVFNKNLKWQNIFILVASYLFYGWWDWRFLFLIAFTTGCSWYSGILIKKYLSKNNDKKARLISGLNIGLNIAMLLYFKYCNFFVESFTETFLFLGQPFNLESLEIILPVGISFYTFQALSYTIDVYRKKVEATHDAVSFFAFVSFFPQLVAGPIERASNLLPQFFQKRHFDHLVAVDGMRQMLWGMFKKVVVADNCATVVNQVFNNYQYYDGSTLFVGIILFAIQIYCDFSGYSDIAIGTARLFGFNLMKNFNFPYFSRDIAEFWRRWHISLTTWFRDYIYIPLGGSRCSKGKIIRNTFIIFLLSGFWHGANLTFIAWGAYHALLFLPLILMNKNRKYIDTVASGHLFPSIKEFGQMAFTFFLVVFGWIFFRADTITDAWKYIVKIFSPSLFTIPELIKVPICCFIFVLFAVEWLQRNKEHGFDFKGIQKGWIRWTIYLITILAILLFMGNNEQFIYFQF